MMISRPLPERHTVSLHVLVAIVRWAFPVILITAPALFRIVRIRLIIRIIDLTGHFITAVRILIVIMKRGPCTRFLTVLTHLYRVINLTRYFTFRTGQIGSA